VVAFTQAKVAPMVRGLFPSHEQEVVLGLLGRSVVFLTPDTIDGVLETTTWLHTAWDLANLYLASCGAEVLSEHACRIVGLSIETTGFVTAEYSDSPGRYDDFVVHEAAHIFHNCKRASIGLRETARREWLLDIELSQARAVCVRLRDLQPHSRTRQHARGPVRSAVRVRARARAGG
jgi:hypothetical protein